MNLTRAAFHPTARLLLILLFGAVLAPASLPGLFAQEVAQGTAAPAHRPGGEVNLRLPDLNQGDFLGFTGHQILLSGLVVCVLGLLFGLLSYSHVKNLPVHKSMAEISELIYETCKAYMVQQGKLLLVLFGFIGAVIVVYFLLTGLELPKILAILLFSVIGMAGSYGVAWFGIRINTLANSRTAFAALRGKAWPVSEIPLRSGMSVGMMLISVELLFMLRDSALHPGGCGGSVLPRLRDRRITRRGGAAYRRRHLHQDCRHRVGPDEGGLQDQGRRRPEPRRHRRLHRRQRG